MCFNCKTKPAKRGHGTSNVKLCGKQRGCLRDTVTHSLKKKGILDIPVKKENWYRVINTERCPDMLPGETVESQSRRKVKRG